MYIEGKAVEIDTSITSLLLVRVLEQVKRERALPQVLRTDNGPEFLGEAFVQWPPNQNAFIERSNRTFREEVLDQHLYVRLEDVRDAV